MIPLFLNNQVPYALAPQAKYAFLKEGLYQLYQHHLQRCQEYKNLASNFSISRESGIYQYPFIPVEAFKEFDLKSTNGKAKLLKSSGTTGNYSRIYVDKETAKRQTFSAHCILADYIGQARRPYLVFDAEESLRGSFLTARGAAAMSLTNFASKIYFLMDSDRQGQLHLNQNRFKQAIDEINGKPFLAYGFTYILWEVYKKLEHADFRPSFINPESLFLHSGGWKKMKELAVSKAEYNRRLSSFWKVKKDKVLDFYGLIEQLGILYPDCPAGYKHVPYWADIIIRRADSLAEAAAGETGLIELVSLLPLSSPAHIILTQDLGRIALEDNCVCQRRGKAFAFVDRAEQSSKRGCSDVYQ